MQRKGGHQPKLKKRLRNYGKALGVMNECLYWIKKKIPPRKTQKTKNQRILNIKMSTKGGSVLHLAYQGGKIAPLPPIDYATDLIDQ